VEFNNRSATKSTPAIDFDDTSGILSISGTSYPENGYEFYEFLLKWIKEYLTQTDTLTINMEIIYMNSGTTKVFYDLFSLLDEFKNSGKVIHVHWIYDEENCSAQENGEDYQEDFKELDIQLVEKENN